MTLSVREMDFEFLACMSISLRGFWTTYIYTFDDRRYSRLPSSLTSQIRVPNLR